MTRLVFFAMLCSLLLTACPREEVTCDDEPEHELCREDTGMPPDTGMPDTGPVDAGPCDGMCSGATPLCRSSDDTCVACLADGDCSDLTAPRCDTTAGACTACDDSSQCTGRTGTELCATDGPNMGSCVQCTAAEATACATNPCTTANTCSEYGEAAQDTCEACDTDDNCSEAEHFCVPMEFPSGTARAGGNCLKTSPGCDRPYSIDISGRTSLSGVMGQVYCGVNEDLATCEAVRALVGDAMCPGGEDTECPEGGVCKMVGSLSGTRCTYRCVGASECITPPTAGNTCGDGSTGGDDYCGG